MDSVPSLHHVHAAILGGLGVPHSHSFSSKREGLVVRQLTNYRDGAKVSSPRGLRGNGENFELFRNPDDVI